MERIMQDHRPLAACVQSIPTLPASPPERALLGFPCSVRASEHIHAREHIRYPWVGVAALPTRLG
jgi:hypothetical protein